MGRVFIAEVVTYFHRTDFIPLVMVNDIVTREVIKSMNIKC